MIINGGSRCNAGFFSKHLINAEKNEHVTLTEIRGLSAKHIGSAFREMKAVASGTKCKNFFYHANINPRDDERLTPEQWGKAIDALEQKLGLEDHARFVVEHEKEGRVHRHIVWSRINVETMRAVRMDKDYAKHQEVARSLEKEFGLSPVTSVLGTEIKSPRPERRPEQWEVFRGKQRGIDVFDMKNEITELWNETEDGKSFVSGLEEHGYILARGDSRKYCVVDQKGDIHSLARRIEGVKAADIRSRFTDIDIEDLPHVNQAVALQRERYSQSFENEDEKRQALVEKEEEGRQEILKDEEARQQLVLQEEERRQEAVQQEESRRLEMFKEQAESQEQLAKEMEQQQQRFEAYRAFVAQQAEIARRDAQRQQVEKTANSGVGEIRDAHSRYGQALGQHYDIRDPYSSLARSAMAEYGAFLRDRENLNRQIGRTSDPLELQKLELRKQIEAADYMAITSERIARQTEIVVGKMNAPAAMRERERAKAFQEEAKGLRKEYQEIGASQDLKQEGTRGHRAEPFMAQKESSPSEKAPPALMVEERISGKPRGQEQKLVDFVKKLPEKQPSREFTSEEIRNNPEAKKAYYSQIRDEKNRDIAVNQIGKDIKWGNKINSEDVRWLNKNDLEGIKKHGDKHLKDIVQQHEKERERGQGLER